MSTLKHSIFHIVLAAVVLCLPTGCGLISGSGSVYQRHQGTTTGNPLIDMDLTFVELMIPIEMQDTSLCITELALRSQSKEDQDHRIALDFGDVYLSSMDSVLAKISLPEGVYKEIKLKLRNKCASGTTVSLSNKFGDFTTTDRIDIKFNEVFAVSSGTTAMSLNIQFLVDALALVQSSHDIETALEDAVGFIQDGGGDSNSDSGVVRRTRRLSRKHGNHKRNWRRRHRRHRRK